MHRLLKLMMLTVCGSYLTLVIGCGLIQRKLLYFPTHHHETAGLKPLMKENEIIGYGRSVENPKYIWLILHGNGAQAAYRSNTFHCYPKEDAIFIVEYPGYGLRPGSPSKAVFNAAAEEAYFELRRRYPGKAVCVVGESLGSGPASHLGTLSHPPEKIILVVPFNTLSSVASDHFPFLPIGLLLRDNWNNAEALEKYHGPVEIYGAKADTIIPVKHAMALATRLPQATLHLIPGEHNEWPAQEEVRFTNP